MDSNRNHTSMSATPRTDQVELEQMDEFARTLERELATVIVERDALAAKLAEAQKDTERLNFLISNRYRVIDSPDTGRFYLVDKSATTHCGDSAIEVIDAARTKQS